MVRAWKVKRPRVPMAVRGRGAISRRRRRVKAGVGRLGARLAALLAAAGLGALAEYFFLDRQHAVRRRHLVRDRARATVRRRAQASVRRTKYLEGVAEGIAHTPAHALRRVRARKETPDDVTLAQKVRSTAFRKAHVPKEHVSVNAEKGTVFLRGQLDDEQSIHALVRMVASVEGVREVKNMLRTSGGNDDGG
jgi:BON domain